MTATADLNPRIIETLYQEGLLLSDEVRRTFDLARAPREDAEDPARLALSCEALRTTTRMMHAIAWLLNHRAFGKGEISAFQLHRHGRLASSAPADPTRLALLEPSIRDLIRATERFHARLMRLDADWRERERMAEPAVPAIRSLRERLARAVS